MRFYSLLFCVLMGASRLVYASPQAGIIAYQQGNYSKALSLLTPSAEGGDLDAQYTLGVMYDRGLGVRKDDDEALFWYRLSAEQGEAAAQYALGTFYRDGRAMPRDYRDAFRLFAMAAQQGYIPALFESGRLHYVGVGEFSPDYQHSMYWFRRLAGDHGPGTGAEYFMGLMYASGQGVRKNPVIAYALLSLEAERHKSARTPEETKKLTQVRAKLAKGMTPAAREAAQTMIDDIKRTGRVVEMIDLRDR